MLSIFYLSLASALSFLAPLHLTSSAVVPPQKFPMLPRQTNSSKNDVSLPNATKKFYANALCSPEKQLIEQLTWNDASLYANALASWRPNGSYQAAMDMYMGNDSRGPIGDILEANIAGAVSVHTQSTWPEKQRVFVLCEEPDVELIMAATGSDMSVCDSDPKIAAYTFPQLGKYFDNHYIVFCPTFYKMKTLSQALIQSNEGMWGMEPDNIHTLYWNQAYTYFHESLHLASLTTPANHEISDSDNPYRWGPLVYGPEDVVREARDQNTGACIHTADAYAVAAAAVLAQQLFQLSDPPTLPTYWVTTKELVRFPREIYSGGLALSSSASPYFPDPDTIDNHIAINDLGFGSSTLTTERIDSQTADRHAVSSPGRLVQERR